MIAYTARVRLLRSPTDPRWIDVALAELDRTLQDHAHCEKKAAASALKLVADHPERAGMVRALAKLAQEELQHFLGVLAELGRRGTALPPDDGDPYAQALLRHVRGGPRPEDRLVDRLLVAALIEARSCERLWLLAGALPEARLRELYARLAQSEAGHERLFVDLAREVDAAADARLEVLAEEEARVVAALPLLPRIH
ncbi:tRNA-hydroxylase [Anaeromyxobacter dehalogenans 2CP-1]|uniref:tRNA-hydroxylase n=1 Tax=Anaeromyxobacter dehalogenans (strain ATCC BAA-258 / DSM 21875 / 2CP-1) TaxID=455488 RepID=B8J9X4_ANAD2|nr:tRNA-hydroxylase [Anaeromyxobacter dehalogenans 2CP-1]